MRVVVSLLLVYHLAAMVLLPNPNSILTHALTPVLAPYADTLAINTPFRFFAPNPGRHRYLEVEFIGQGDAPFYWPPRERSGLLTERYNRRIYHSILTTASLERAEKYFVPWICRNRHAPREFSLRAVVIDIPHIALARYKPNTFSGPQREFYLPPQHYHCEGALP